ncbi:hypothetical protein Bbelb_204740 [Branchiostoma belcheri]|nr:hypothetical protein Bbelb_204740 [Branchiostoma belcheri]
MTEKRSGHLDDIPPECAGPFKSLPHIQNLPPNTSRPRLAEAPVTHSEPSTEHQPTKNLPPNTSRPRLAEAPVTHSEPSTEHQPTKNLPPNTSRPRLAEAPVTHSEPSTEHQPTKNLPPNTSRPRLAEAPVTHSEYSTEHQLTIDVGDANKTAISSVETPKSVSEVDFGNVAIRRLGTTLSNLVVARTSVSQDSIPGDPTPASTSNTLPAVEHLPATSIDTPPDRIPQESMREMLTYR